MFAVIVDDDAETDMVMQRQSSQNEPDESEDSTIDFPAAVNAPAANYQDTEETVLLHYGEAMEPIPVFSVDEKPLDGPSTLTNAIKCPVKYISKTPPSLVVDNYCFICDGDEVSENEILLNDQQWWKQTSCSTRFYSSDNMTTFKQVTLLSCRGEIRGAYRTRTRGAGLTKVSLSKVFRVSRYFSCWRSCHLFHRIVSVITPVTKAGEQINNFRKRIFVQYFWRSEKPLDRSLVTREYLEAKMPHKDNLTVPSSSTSLKSWAPSRLHSQSSQGSSTSTRSSPNMSPRGSQAMKEGSKWRVFNQMYRTTRALQGFRKSTKLELPLAQRRPSEDT